MYVQPPVYREEGILESFDITVDENGKELRSAPYKGWFNANIINNDDEDTVYVLINGQTPVRPTKIKAGENRIFKYDYPAIWRIFLYMDAGKTADTRVEAGR